MVSREEEEGKMSGKYFIPFKMSQETTAHIIFVFYTILCELGEGTQLFWIGCMLFSVEKISLNLKMIITTAKIIHTEKTQDKV